MSPLRENELRRGENSAGCVDPESKVRSRLEGTVVVRVNVYGVVGESTARAVEVNDHNAAVDVAQINEPVGR